MTHPPVVDESALFDEEEDCVYLATVDLATVDLATVDYTSRDGFRNELARVRCRTIIDPLNEDLLPDAFDPDRDTPARYVMMNEDDDYSLLTLELDESPAFDSNVYWETRGIIDDDPSVFTEYCEYESENESESTDYENDQDDYESESESESESETYGSNTPSQSSTPTKGGYSQYEYPPGRPTHSTAQEAHEWSGSEEDTVLDEEEETECSCVQRQQYTYDESEESDSDNRSCVSRRQYESETDESSCIQRQPSEESESDSDDRSCIPRHQYVYEYSESEDSDSEYSDSYQIRIPYPQMPYPIPYGTLM